jgi:hypothetical protein
VLPYLPHEWGATLPASEDVTAVTNLLFDIPSFFGHHVIDVQSPTTAVSLTSMTAQKKERSGPSLRGDQLIDKGAIRSE